MAAAAALTTWAATSAGASAAAVDAGCGELFDDFHYTSVNDSNFQSHGWNARSEAGGPGVPGASWLAGNITFVSSGGDQVAQLRGSTDGTAAGTTHAELRTTQQRFHDGTYATRVRYGRTGQRAGR